MDVSLLDIYNWLQSHYTPGWGVTISFTIWYLSAWLILRLGFTRNADGDVAAHTAIWVLSPIIYPIAAAVFIVLFIVLKLFPTSK